MELIDGWLRDRKLKSARSMRFKGDLVGKWVTWGLRVGACIVRAVKEDHLLVETPDGYPVWRHEDPVVVEVDGPLDPVEGWISLRDFSYRELGYVW